MSYVLIEWGLGHVRDRSADWPHTDAKGGSA